MLEVFQSEFLWGIVIGLVLSIIGAWSVAHFTISKQRDNQRKLIRRLVRDTAQNIVGIADEFDDTKNRTKLIYGDLLTLIDIEVGIYGRNREHLVLLPEEDAEAARKFFTDVSTSRAEVLTKLAEFNRLYNQGEQIKFAGRIPEGLRLQKSADKHLTDAKTAADRLVSKARQADKLIQRLVP